MAADFKLLLMPEITCICSIDGEPAAVALAMPNLNELVRDMHGKLFPLGLPKLLWRLKVRGPKSARLILLGIRKKYRNMRKYAPLSAFMYAEMNDGAKSLGIEEGELGVDARGQRPRQRRHHDDGREALQDVPRLREGADQRSGVKHDEGPRHGRERVSRGARGRGAVGARRQACGRWCARRRTASTSRR